MGAIGSQTSLRYAVQLLNPGSIYSDVQGRKEINKEEIEEINNLFYDAKASAKILTEQSDKFIN